MKIIMIMAVTADGKIAKNAAHFPDWTAKEDKNFFKERSMEAGAVIMGGRTFETFPRPLKDRLNVIVTDEDKYNEAPGVKVFYKKSPGYIKNELAKMGYKEAILGGGGFMNGLFLEAKVVDEMIIIIAPKLFGRGVSLIEGFDFDYDLELVEERKINKDSVLLRYKIIY